MTTATTAQTSVQPTADPASNSVAEGSSRGSMLSIRNLSKTFRLHMLGGVELPAISEVSFEVRPGEFVGLAGPSGAGKSTVLKCIHRTYLATSGEILYTSADSRVVDLVSVAEGEILEFRRTEIGFVSQFLRVIPRVGAQDLVAEPIRLRLGVDLETARLRAASLLDRLGIPRKLFSAYPATFSGGEQQRVNIARAVAWEPRLLLLDEPTASLDKRSVEAVVDLFAQLRQNGATMVGVFHDPELLERITDRIVRIGSEP
jgi:alpha-D-ribose 1-methylphosphonate 5-triphosphate synthase subunit PhnL